MEINEDEVALEPQDATQKVGVNPAETTLYALVGSPFSNTMRIKGKIKNQEVVSLIDSGSTHTFLDATVLPSLQRQLDTTQILDVKVADGTITKTLGS